jgi:hypothetical protein
MPESDGDLLYGGPAIRNFLNTLGSRVFSLNHTYRLIADERVPTRVNGRKVRVASKREIRAALGLAPDSER